MMRRRVTRCDACGIEYTVRYSTEQPMEFIYEAKEHAHQLRSPDCKADPWHRHMVSDEPETDAAGVPRPDSE
jgi:hypothetical protein